MKDFRNKVAVITGGASGVGRAIGIRLGREGAKIVLADIEKGALETTVGELKALGIDAIGQATDVSKYESVEALADKSFGHFGGVHLLFNNAGVGIGEAARVWDTPMNSLVWAFNVNWWGVVHGVRAFMPRLVEQNQEAHVINTSSGVGLLTLPNSATYSATKAAVIAYTEALHFQLQGMDSPVKAALLFPGPHIVATGLYNSGRNRPKELAEETPVTTITSLEDMQKMVEAFTGKRLDVTQPEEVAETTVEALRRDQFWLLPQTERFQKAIRQRTEDMLAERIPNAPDVL